MIVKEKKVVAYRNQDLSGPTTSLKFFRKYFIFKESGQAYLVGDATLKKSIIGWVQKKDVLPWNTKQAIFFINKQASDRIPVRVWMSADDIGNPKKPHFVENLNRNQTTEPFPILKKQGSLVKVAFLWNVPSQTEALSSDGFHDEQKLFSGQDATRQTTGKATSGDALATLTEQVERMDVVLVMDVTRSMGPYMNKVRKNLIDIVKRLSEMSRENNQVPIYIGIVAYRDYADEESSFMTEAFPLTTEHKKVVNYLHELKPFSKGKGINEAVFDGVYDGIQSMDWGEHSFRVLCLIGDAPPHRMDDKDTKLLLRTDMAPGSEFFNQPFADNVTTIQEMLEENRIHFYALGVGKNREMKKSFQQLAGSSGEFILLANSKHFIQGLEQKLKKSLGERDKVVVDVKKVFDPNRDPGSVTARELESLTAVGLSLADLKTIGSNLIQTGWFKPDLDQSAAVTLYTRRRDLADWSDQLRGDLLNYKHKQADILSGIIDMHAQGTTVNSIEDAIKVGNDLAYQPEILQLQNLNMEDKLKVQVLRKKLSNIQKLLVMDKLFNKNEEGWVPLELVPGSFREN